MNQVYRTGFFTLLLVSLAWPLAAQDSTPSLGDVARQERARKQNLVANAAPTDADASVTAPLTQVSQFTFTLTENQSGRQSTTRGFADGAKFRLEPDDSKSAEDPQGYYAMSLDNGSTTYLIHPAKKEFVRVDAVALKTKVMEKAIALYSKLDLQIESPKVETVLTEPGEMLDGHPTVHHKLRVSYSMHYVKTNVVVPYIEYQDLWMASDIGREGAPDILIYFRPTGDPRIDDAWEQALARIPGFPLRQVTLRTEVNEDGNSAVVRISRDVTGVHAGPVPESLFVLPANFKEVPGKETDFEVH